MSSAIRVEVYVNVGKLVGQDSEEKMKANKARQWNYVEL